jgi:hypothetical protein
MKEASKFSQEYLNGDACPEDIANPMRGLLESGDVKATMQQQRFHSLWRALLAPMNILCAAIAGAHHTHREVSNLSGSPLIQKSLRRARNAAANVTQESK